MPIRYKVSITPLAENDAQEIWSYIAADSVRAATAFVLELDHQLSTLQTFPARCPLVSENEGHGTSYRHLLFGEYRTIFGISGDHVHVLRIVHGSRLLDLSVFEDI